MKRVLITGGMGFIGKPTVKCLRDLGYEVHVTTREDLKSKNIHKCDLFNYLDVKSVMEKVKPQYLVHLAWETNPSEYLNAESNLEWVSASINLLKCFVETGGKRVLMSGTCFEYDFIDEPLSEDCKLAPLSLYSASKIGLQMISENYTKSKNVEFIWARLFYIFGEDENEQRVVPYIVNHLLKGEKVTCKNSSALRDYMYVKDVAKAISLTLDSKLTGKINIASGKKISMGSLFSSIANICGHPDLVNYLDNPVVPKVIVADVNKLHNELGFAPIGIEKALVNVVKSIKYKGEFFYE